MPTKASQPNQANQASSHQLFRRKTCNKRNSRRKRLRVQSLRRVQLLAKEQRELGLPQSNLQSESLQTNTQWKPRTPRVQFQLNLLFRRALLCLELLNQTLPSL